MADAATKARRTSSEAPQGKRARVRIDPAPANSAADLQAAGMVHNDLNAGNVIFDEVQGVARMVQVSNTVTTTFYSLI